MKRQTMLTIDEELIERAKAQHMNISGTINDLLGKALSPRKKDIHEDNLKAFCNRCKQEIEKGYICNQTKRTWCEDCHEKIKMTNCMHDTEGQHEHQRWGDDDEK